MPITEAREVTPAVMKAGQSKQWLFAAAIILLTLLAYQPVWHAGFVWDDASWTTDISSLLRDFSGLRTIWCKLTALQQYYPLTATTFWLDYHLWGFWPLPYHVENVLLHAFAALLFWRLLRRLEVPGGWLAGAIFALHPVMVESAGWVTERKNVLSLVLYLGALLAYGRVTSFWKEDEDSLPRGRAYLLALALALGALLAKTTALSLPAVILLICWWERGRIRWRADVQPTLPFFALAISLSLVTAWIEKNHVGAQGPEWAISFPQRCLIAGRVVWFYIGKLLWPVNLCFIYPRWQLNAGSVSQWLYPITAVGTLFALWLTRRKIGRGPATAAFFFVGTLFPVLGFVSGYFMLYSFVCDHWTYLPSLGLIALGAALVARTADRLRAPAVLYGFAAVILPALMILTWRQCQIYTDMETLWRDTLAKNPDCWMAHNNLSMVLINEGRLEEAIRHGEQSLQSNPKNVNAHRNLGVALTRAGRVQDAIGHYEQAVRAEPNDARTQNDLSIVLIREGRLEEAIRHGEQAVQLKPDDPDIYKNLAGALMLAGRFQDAIGYCQRAVRVAPSDSEAYNHLGAALIGLGKFQEAIEPFEQALHINPNDVRARLNLSMAANNLAWQMATHDASDGGDPGHAVILARRACELTGNREFAYLDTLAAAYAAAGRFNDAITTAQQAIGLARSAGQTQVVSEIESRLELYRAGRAYRAPASVTSPHDP
jgi:Flp pilus assembly protein TadD